MALDLDKRADFELEKGCSFDAGFFEHLDGRGDPIDLAGASATANFYLGTPEAPGALAYQADTANGRFVIDSSGDPATHSAAWALTPAQVAAAAAAGSAWYEYVLTLASGSVSRPAWGLLTFVPTGASP